MSRLLLLYIVCLFNCKNNIFEQDLSIGNVYVNKEIKNHKKNIDFPISSFRIEKKLKDKLLIKYRIDDVFINSYINMTSKDNCYSEKIMLDLNKKNKSNIEFEFTKNKAILISEGKKYYFIFSYKDDIIEKEIGNPYYSEDGFDFFSK